MVENGAKWALEFLDGPLQGQTQSIFDGLVIGRHSECDLQIVAGHLSRHHAKFVYESSGLFILDLDSSNGTFVNGKQVNKQSLSVGDCVKLDKISILISEVASSSESTVVVTPQSSSAVETTSDSKPETIPEPQKAPSAVPTANDKSINPEAASNIPWWEDQSAGPEGTQFLDPNAVVESSPNFLADESLLRKSKGPALVGITPPYKGKLFDLGRGKISVGNSSENDIAINDDTVSATHAQLLESGGGWKLVNLLSANGTYVNNTKIQTAYLSNGDHVRFGATSFHFYAGSEKISKPAGRQAKNSALIFVATFIVVALVFAAAIYWYYENY